MTRVACAGLALLLSLGRAEGRAAETLASPAGRPAEDVTAETSGIAAVPNPYRPTPEAGLAVIRGAVPNLTARQACQRCHGEDGVGDGSGAFPRLTGQASWYLYKQLQDYASGARPNMVMTPIARSMTLEQMQAAVAWYARQEAPALPVAREVPPEPLQWGGTFSAVGDPQRGITACVWCHGAAGEGIPPSLPSLAGQYVPYTRLQLELWQRDVRRNDPAAVMREIARAMTAEDIKAIAAYFAASPPAPAGSEAGAGR